MDHYATLGLARGANPQDIKKAYRKLASKHHPDKGGDAEQFKQVQKAYEVLSDPEKKEFFDQYGTDSPQDQGFNPFGEGSPFGDMFSQFGQQYRRARQNPDALVDYPIDMATAYKGQEVIVDVGYAREIVQIQPGMRNGTKIRIPGKGHSRYKDIPAGDLIVRLHVRPDPGTAIDGDNILQSVRINAIEAMIGTEVQVDHVSGKKVRIKVPAGTQEGSRLRLSNWGMPIYNRNLYGNLYAVIEVFTPRISDSGHLEMLNKINREIDR